MAVLLTEKMIAEISEKWEFSDARERRKCFDKMREHGEEALRLIVRLNHALDRAVAEKVSKASPTDDFMDMLNRIKRGEKVSP